jgi:hypothetical protein
VLRRAAFEHIVDIVVRFGGKADMISTSQNVHL